MTLTLDFALRRGSLDLALRLEVAPGETLALVGPIGAGKSSCLAAIVGIVRIARGHIALDGELLDDGARSVPTERRGIGCLFQEPLLPPERARQRRLRPARAGARSLRGTHARA